MHPTALVPDAVEANVRLLPLVVLLLRVEVEGPVVAVPVVLLGAVDEATENVCRRRRQR